jgi:hypothetical protein
LVIENESPGGHKNSGQIFLREDPNEANSLKRLGEPGRAGTCSYADYGGPLLTRIVSQLNY